MSKTNRKGPLGQVKIPSVRISYPALFKPEEKYGKYKVTLLIPKKAELGKKIIADLEEAYAEVSKEAFEGKVLTFKGNKYPIRDGDELDEEGEEKGEEYKGHWYIVAKSTKRPTVVDNDSNRTPISEEDNRVYAGCYCHAVVQLYASKDKDTRGIYVNLQGVQFHKDGEAFGAAPLDSKEFDDFDEFNTEEDLV